MRTRHREDLPAPADPSDAVRLVYEMIPYLHCAPLLAGRRVLEVGCGPGFGARHVAAVAREVHAYDADPGNVAWARTHQAAPALSFRLDGEDPAPEPRAYEAVLSLRALDRGARPRSHLRALAGFVAPGGQVIVGVRNRLVPAAGITRSAGGLAPAEFASLLQPLFGRVRLLGVRGNAKVRAYREHRRRAREESTATFRKRLARWLPGEAGPRPGRGGRPPADVADAGAPSPLAIDPDDFSVQEEDAVSAERLLAICARDREV